MYCITIKFWTNCLCMSHGENVSWREPIMERKNMCTYIYLHMAYLNYNMKCNYTIKAGKGTH